MSQTAPPDPPKRAETLLEPAPPPLPPFIPPANLAALPGYRIQKLLGKGGMGEVYLAHNEPMDRPEVLKAVQKDLLARAGALERFQQEIRNAGRLQHPNIVTAYACLQAGDTFVLAMEYVPGQDLAAVVKIGGALPVANAAHYIRQAALGLQHAFEKGMVHRDIKPHNLMLARDGTRHTVKVLDFGLAKVTSEKPIDGGLTRDGQMLGTPDYIAPEQTRDAARADIRSDIYSLGCTLHFLLAGRPPYTGGSLFEILEAHNVKAAPRLDELRPEVPKGLADVVAKMMAKDPAQRYQTPAQVAVALQPFTKPAARVLMSKPAGPPPPPLPPVGSASTAPGLSGKTPPPIPKSTGSQWNFEESAERKRVARPPAPARKSKLGLVLGLLAVFVLAGGAVGGLYVAGVFTPKTSPTTGESVAKAPPAVEPETKAEPPAVAPPPPPPPPPPKTAVPKGKKGKFKNPDPTPIELPKIEEDPIPVRKKIDPAPPVVPALTWSELFNGRDTTGWELGEESNGTWKAANNEIVGTGTDRVHRPVALLTRAAYRNFVLKFEAFADDDVERRLLVRARTTSNHLKGYALHLTGGRSAVGALAVFDGDPIRCLPTWQRPADDVRPATGKWSAWEVVCVGPRVHVKVDGREVADWELDRDVHQSGGVGFTAAGATDLRVRKLVVADLPAKPLDACRLAGIAERGRETGSAGTPIPYGAAFWQKWETFGKTEWDLTPDGRLTLTGVGGLVTRAAAADLSVALSAGADAECWAGIKLSGSAGVFVGPGVRVLGNGTKIVAGHGAPTASGTIEGTGRDYKPGEVIRIEVAVLSKLEFPNGTQGQAERIPRMIGTVFSPSQARQETCKVQLDNTTPGRVGLLLKKGSVAIKAIDKP